MDFLNQRHKRNNSSVVLYLELALLGHIMSDGFLFCDGIKFRGLGFLTLLGHHLIIFVSHTFVLRNWP